MQAVSRKVDVPTRWCAGIVVVLKVDGNVCIYADLTKLNVNICCYILPSVDHSLIGARVFSKLDATLGLNCQMLQLF